MKFNLKNRPGCCLHVFRMPKHESHLYDCNINEWFEGFEKELNDIIKELGNEHDRHWIAIEEILGE